MLYWTLLYRNLPRHGASLYRELPFCAEHVQLGTSLQPPPPPKHVHYEAARTVSKRAVRILLYAFGVATDVRRSKIILQGILLYCSYDSPIAVFVLPNITIFYRFLLIIGGGHEWESASLQQIHAFDTEENNWNTWVCQEDVTHGFPRSRSSFGCELLDNYIYIFGGRHYTKQGGEWALNSCWRLDLEQKAWERLNLTLPIDVYFHTSCLSSTGYVYLFGGISDDQKRINHIYRLRVFVPRLSEIAWEKITHCIKNLSKKHIPILTQAGVPGNFIHRLS